MSVRGGGTGISYPVSISDVQTVLGNNSSELKDLCTDQTINKWARFKPERIDGHLPVSHGTTTADLRTRKENNFSLEVPYCISVPGHWNPWYLNVMNGMVYDIVYGQYTDHKYDAWNYLKPRGDMSQTASHTKEFYRLSDFASLKDDTTNPYDPETYTSAKGYNHNAEEPFVTFLDTSTGGISELTKTIDGLSETVYEVNKQVTKYLTVKFHNGRGDDLHLQDFIDLGEDPSGFAWKPVLQVFNHDPEYNESSLQYEDWFERNHADVEVAGSNITADNGNTVWSVTLDLSNYDGTSPSAASTYYHLCVGIGLCKTDGSGNITSWGSGNHTLFVVPYTRDQEIAKQYPLHFIFSVVEHDTRQFTFTNLVWYMSTVGTNVPGFDSFMVSRYAFIDSNAAYITFNVTKTAQAVQFIKNSDTGAYTNAAMKIKVVESISGTPTGNEFYLEPYTQGSSGYADRTSALVSTPGGIPIPALNTQDPSDPKIVTLYSYFTSSTLNTFAVGTAVTYRIYTLTGDPGQAWSATGKTWVDNGVFSIYRKNN